VAGQQVERAASKRLTGPVAGFRPTAPFGTPATCEAQSMKSGAGPLADARHRRAVVSVDPIRTSNRALRVGSLDNPGVPVVGTFSRPRFSLSRATILLMK
jgi:hypothetical protein